MTNQKIALVGIALCEKANGGRLLRVRRRAFLYEKKGKMGAIQIHDGNDSADVTKTAKT
jgi:hypothetical protein